MRDSRATASEPLSRSTAYPAEAHGIQLAGGWRHHSGQSALLFVVERQESVLGLEGDPIVEDFDEVVAAAGLNRCLSGAGVARLARRDERCRRQRNTNLSLSEEPLTSIGGRGRHRS
jgi:hypothetical protein